MAIDALYEITLTSVYAQQIINNVFFYERNSTAVVNAGIPEFNLEQYFDGFVIPALKAATTTSIDYRRTLVREVFPAFGFREVVYAENNTGTIVADTLPTFVSMELYSARTRGDVRAGYKRFSGVSEGFQTNGIISGAGITLLTTIATRLNAVVQIEENGETVGLLTPKIVKRIKEVDAQGKVTYRLPATLAEYVGASVNYVPRERLTTQNSRKVGRGI